MASSIASRVRLVLALVAASTACLSAAPNSVRLATTDFTPEELAQGYSNQKLIATPLDTADGASLDDATEAALATLETAAGFEIDQVFPRFGNMRVLRLPDGVSPTAARAQLLATGRYRIVDLDHIVQTVATPNDPSFTSGAQWHHRNTGQSGGTIGADIGSVAAWDIRHDASTVIVAVIDSGARITHQDLVANLWTNSGEIAGNGRDDDGNGYIDDVHGINARIALRTSGDGDPTDDDDVGHGTHVSGIIGAVANNGAGTVGVAWTVQLMPLKFLGGTDGTGSTSDGIECINYAIAHGAKVINASYGAVDTDGGYSQSELEAVKRARDAGIVFVAAAGNDALNLDLSRAYPASFELDNMLTVGNSTRLDDMATSSNFGSGAIDLFAPGSEIVSTSSADDSSVRTLTGTSMAAPMVSGAIALLRAQYPQDSYRQSINRLLRGTAKVTAFSGKSQTGGRLYLPGAFAANSTRPFNDDFADRAVLAGNVVKVRSSSIDATTESGESSHSGKLSRSLWFSWTAPTAGLVSIDTRGSLGDTQLSVYTGTSLNALTLIAENDNESAGFLTSRLTFNATTGTTYQIAVDGTSAGLVIINLAAAAANDAFDSAQMLDGDAPLVTTTNANATKQSGEPTHSSGANGKSLWYRWIAPKSGTFQVSAYATSADPVLAVYTGNTVTSLTRIGSNDDSGIGGVNPNALLSFHANEGTTYSIALDTTGSTVGEITLSLTDAIWQFPTGSSADDAHQRPTITNVPAVGPDGTIYVCSADEYFYAINPNGALQWRYPLDGYSDSSAAAVAPDGTILLGTYTGTIYALNPDGTLRWSAVPTTSAFVAAPAIAPDGTAYFRDDEGVLRAYSPNGTALWTYSVAGAGSYAGPAITDSGTIIVPANDGALHAVSPAGTLIWRYLAKAADGSDDASGIYTSPSIDNVGNIYASTLNGTVFSIKSDGTLRWVYRTPEAGENVTSSLALGDGKAYFASYAAYLYALDQSDGSLVWRSSIEAQARASSPAIADDGSILVGSYANKLFRFSRDGELLRSWSAGNWFRSSPTIANGRAYVGNGDGKLYAFDLDGAGPAHGTNYPWPQYRHGPRHLGRATIEALGWVVPDSPDDPGRLVNLSVRNITDHGLGVLTAGFVLQGTVGKELVIRGIGPTLADYGVGGNLSAAAIRVYNSTDSLNPIATNSGWTNATGDGRELGAFALPSSSADSVVRRSFGSEAYTAQILPASDNTPGGIALVEIYDASPTDLRTKLANLSARTELAANGDVTVGFVLVGQTPRKVLIRAVGPTLLGYGITNALANPRLTLMRSTTAEAGNDDWNGNDAIQAAAAVTGAFAIPSNSADAALLTTLPPGIYTVQVTAPANQTGVVLVELYLVP